VDIVYARVSYSVSTLLSDPFRELYNSPLRGATRALRHSVPGEVARVAAIGVIVGRRETVEPLQLRPQTFSRGSGTNVRSEKGSCVRVIAGWPRGGTVRGLYLESKGY
jgi:hypothetical protein